MAEHQELSDKVFFFNSFACVSSSLLVHLSSRWPSPLITWLSVANHCQESAIKADGTHWVRLWFWGLRHAHFLSSRFRSCCWHRPQVWWQSPRRLLYCSFRCRVLRGWLCHRLAPRLLSRRRGTRGLRSLRLSLHWLALFPAPSVVSSGAAPARALLDIGRWTFTALSLVAPFQMPVRDHVYQLQELYLIILRVVAVTKQLRGWGGRGAAVLPLFCFSYLCCLPRRRSSRPLANTAIVALHLSNLGLCEGCGFRSDARRTSFIYLYVKISLFGSRFFQLFFFVCLCFILFLSP